MRWYLYLTKGKLVLICVWLGTRRTISSCGFGCGNILFELSSGCDLGEGQMAMDSRRIFCSFFLLETPLEGFVFALAFRTRSKIRPGWLVSRGHIAKLASDCPIIDLPEPRPEFSHRHYFR